MNEYNYVSVLDLSDACGWENIAEGHSTALAYQKKIDADWGMNIEAAVRRVDESFQERLAAWREYYHPGRKHYQGELKENKTKGTRLLIIFCGLSYLYFVYLCFSLLLLGSKYSGLWLLFYIFIGVIGLGTSIYSWQRITTTKKILQTKINTKYPKPNSMQVPRKPLTSVVLKWWSQITTLAFEWESKSSTSPSEKYDHFGIKGEYKMIEELVPWPSNKTDFVLILHSVLIDRNLDADLIVLAPSGIFLLECKYWQGKVSYQNGI